MKIVEYLFRKVIPLFVGALIFFAMVLVLVDLMMNLWNFISNGVPGLKVMRIMGLYVPKCLWYDKVVVPTFAKKTAEQEEVLNKNKTLNNDKIVILSENGNICYKAEFYDDEAKRLTSLYIIIRNEDKTLNSVIRADSAVWREDRWVLSGAIQYTQGDDTIKAVSLSPDVSDRLVEPPETFQNNVISVETVNSATAKVYIEHLQKAGLPFAEPMSLYYKKFSFPFILFIVVFLSVGLSGKTRKNVMLMSLASCISAAVLFYVTQMITMLLAKFGAISPFMGAWFPVFMFVVIAAVVLRYART